MEITAQWVLVQPEELKLDDAIRVVYTWGYRGYSSQEVYEGKVVFAAEVDTWEGALVKIEYRQIDGRTRSLTSLGRGEAVRKVYRKFEALVWEDLWF